MSLSSRLLSLCVLIVFTHAGAEEPITLFDGTGTDHWQFRDGAWVIDSDGSLTCRMEEVKQKGKLRVRGMGYAWTKQDYENFELTLSYKLSEGANSGVFYRTDPENPVQGGFEIQLLDDDGFQKVKGKKDPKNLNGAFYDCKGPIARPAKPVGQWNEFKLTCEGPRIRVEINGTLVNDVNVDDWDTPMKNPDGSSNKFKTALKELPRTGRIGFQTTARSFGSEMLFYDRCHRSTGNRFIRLNAIRGFTKPFGATGNLINEVGADPEVL